jgi:hypothetical protein
MTGPTANAPTERSFGHLLSSRLIHHDKCLNQAALRALATGVPTTLCDRRRDLTIISRLPGLIPSTVG